MTEDSSKTNKENYGFYYSREKRLEKAPENVRQLYSGEPAGKKGLLKVLVATKSSRFLFFAILILCASGLFLSVFSKSPGTFEMGGYKGKVSCFEYGNRVYLSVDLECENPDIKNEELLFTVNYLSASGEILFSEDFERFVYPDQAFEFKHRTGELGVIPEKLVIVFFMGGKMYKIKTAIIKNPD